MKFRRVNNFGWWQLQLFTAFNIYPMRREGMMKTDFIGDYCEFWRNMFRFVRFRIALVFRLMKFKKSASSFRNGIR